MPQQLSATEFLRHALDTAHYFGFQPLDTVRAHPNCLSFEKQTPHKASANDRKTDALHGLLTAGMCTYLENKLDAIEGPVLFYSIDPIPRTGETALSLHVLNVEKSIAEAVLIQTIQSILSDIGYAQHIVRINSLGDAESMHRYNRELTNYLRKRVNDLPAPARELMKDHSFTALTHLVEKEHEFGTRSPSPLEYLSDGSRRHFREVVEFLDMSNAAYEIDGRLLGHHQCYSDTLFAFDILDDNRQLLADQPLYIRGGRYNTFVSRMSRSVVPAAGGVVVLRDKKIPSRLPRQKKVSPSVFMVQLGFGPKLRSLLLIDELRRAGIPLVQDVVSDSLSAQLRRAEEINTRFAVIIGQKEFVEQRAIVRDLHSRSQESVALSGLAAYLKRVAR